MDGPGGQAFGLPPASSFVCSRVGKSVRSLLRTDSLLSVVLPACAPATSLPNRRRPASSCVVEAVRTARLKVTSGCAVACPRLIALTAQ